MSSQSAGSDNTVPEDAVSEGAVSEDNSYGLTLNHNIIISILIFLIIFYFILRSKNKILLYLFIGLIIFLGYLAHHHRSPANLVMKLNDTLGQFGNLYQRIRYGYLLSILFAKDNEIYADYIHRYPGKDTNTWFYASGSPIDLYNDGRNAIFVTGGQGQDDALLLYNSDKNIMENIIDGTGLSSKLATYGAVSIDLDKDGYTDLIISREDGVTLYKNIKGSGKFRSIKIMDKQKDATPIGIAVSDYDKDGNPDLFISQFIDVPLAKASQFDNPVKHAPNVMLKGINNHQFKDVSKELGLTGRWNTFTSAFIDLNNDTWPDIVQSPDAARMFIHENKNGKQFFEKSNPAHSGFWMGIASGDYDNDLDEDLFLTNISHKFSSKGSFIRGTIQDDSILNVNHVLLRNDGNFKFVDVTADTNTLKHDFGWGSIFEDINLDGHPDLLFAQNSYFLPNYHLNKSSGAVLLNNNGKFVPTHEYPNPHFGQTPISVDINEDGLKDIVWINLNGPVKAYLNKNKDNNNYINVLLPDNLQFANATVTVTTPDSVQKKHHIIGGLGMAGDQSNMLSFGLAKTNKVNKVVIHTMSGKQYIKINPKINSIIVVKN